MLAYTDRAAAGYLLAELITGLPPDLLELVGATRSPTTRSSAARFPNQRDPCYERSTMTAGRS